MTLQINGVKVEDGLAVLATLDLSLGGTGTQIIKLKDSVADALSIYRASTRMMQFDSSTPKITITPALAALGTLDVTGITTLNGVVTIPNSDLRMQTDNTRIDWGYGNEGRRFAIHIWLLNKSVAASVVGEVFVLDTANNYSVVAGGTGGNQSHPCIIGQAGASLGATAIALNGVVDVDCDTAVISRGDILVTSNAIALKAMANNAQTDPSKIIGVALTAKAAGAAGQVRALIKGY